jgi:hypothetical protein
MSTGARIEERFGKALYILRLLREDKVCKPCRLSTADTGELEK